MHETACQDSFVSIEKAEKVLGFILKYSNQDALLRDLDWYKIHRGERVQISPLVYLGSRERLGCSNSSFGATNRFASSELLDCWAT